MHRRTRLLILEYRRISGVLLVFFGLIFLSSGILGFFLPVTLIMAAVSLALIYKGIRALTARGPGWLGDMAKVEGDELVFSEPVMVTPGRLILASDNGYSMVYPVFRPSGGPERRRRIELSGEGGLISGLEWFHAGGGRPAVEWVDLPAYRVDLDQDGAVVAALPRLRHSIFPDEGSLSVSRGEDYGYCTLTGEGGKLSGSFTYVRARSRSLRLEIQVESGATGVRYRLPIAEMRDSGGSFFEWSPDVEDGVFIFLNPSDPLSIRELLRMLRIDTPIIAGTAWRDARARLRLVLDIPMGGDASDETGLRVDCCNG